eukprot:SAG25_NODE_95_length_15927_cov_8.666224_22_plen_72_part_00
MKINSNMYENVGKSQSVMSKSAIPLSPAPTRTWCIRPRASPSRASTACDLFTYLNALMMRRARHLLATAPQ